MKIILILFCCLPLFAFSNEWEKELLPFKELVIQGRHAAQIKQSDRFHITVKCTDTDFDFNRVQFIFSGERLFIRYDRGNVFREVNIQFEIEVPFLQHIEAKNNAAITVDPQFDLGNAPLTIEVKQGGLIHVSNLKNAWIKAEVQLGGTITLSGNTSLAELKIQTRGTIDAKLLEAVKVNSSIAMGGDILCHPIETLEAEIQGGGRIAYLGNPQLTKDVPYRGKVEPLNE